MKCGNNYYDDIQYKRSLYSIIKTYCNFHNLKHPNHTKGAFVPFSIMRKKQTVIRIVIKLSFSAYDESVHKSAEGKRDALNNNNNNTSYKLTFKK